MESDSDNESIEGNLDEHVTRGQGSEGQGPANWGKAKFDYYFTDYVDKDYPSSLSRKEEKLAWIEQEEAQRIQKKLHSNLDEINLEPIIDFDEAEPLEDATSSTSKDDIIEFIEKRNKLILSSARKISRRKVRFQTEEKAEEYLDGDDDELEGEDDDDASGDDDEDDGADEVQTRKSEPIDERKRRPINMAIKKNRGLTPYKKKEYRNPRVKHKLKYQKAMTKRRKLVKEAQTEFYRYSGESTGIKTSTVKSIKLY